MALKKGPVVVAFYHLHIRAAAISTGGCDVEAHTFAENKERFSKAGATIIGVSEDSIKRLDQFSANPNYCAGRFPVASDPCGKIAAAYGLTVASGKPGMKEVRGIDIGRDFIERETFVIGKYHKHSGILFQSGSSVARCS